MKRILFVLGLISCWFSVISQNYSATSSEACIATTGGQVTLNFASPPPASSQVTITFYYRGDLNGTTSNPEKFDFYDENSNLLGTSNFVSTQCDPNKDSMVVTVAASTYNGWLADGQVDILADADATVSATLAGCSSFGGSCAQAKIEYVSTTGNCANAFSNFLIDSITTGGAKVNWTPGTGNDSFFLEYGPTGFAPGSASGTKITGTYPGSQPPVVITGLTHQTTYDLYFGEICNSGADSVYFAGPQVFTTESLCPPPSNVSVLSTTSNSADVSLNSTFTSFDVEWGPEGFTQGTGCLATLGTTGGVFTLDNSADPGCATQLQPNTVYEFYVRSNCTSAGNGTSVWEGPYKFITECAAFTAPYYNDFETDTLDAPPICWKGYATGSGAFVEVEDFTGTSAPYAGSQALYLYSSSSGSSDTLVAISPQFSDLTAGDKRARFLANSDGPFTQLIVGTLPSPSPGAAFTPVDTITFPVADTYQEVVVNFETANGYNGTDEYIVLAHSLGATFQYIRIDDFNYETIPACTGPLSTSLGATNLTSTTAHAYWGNTGQGDFTRVEWGSPGFTPGTGSGNSTLVAGTDTGYTITGLSSQTTYEFYIQDSCTVGGSGIYLGPYSFTTACAALPTPHTESFDNTSIPSCWSTYSSTGENWTFGSNTYAPSSDHTGNGGEYATVDDSEAPSSPDVTLVSPFFDVSTLNNPELTFFLASADATVTLSVDVWDGTTWNTGVFTHTAATANTWDSIPINLTPYAGSGEVAFRFIVDEQNGSFQNDIAIDDVTVASGPSCPSPGNLAVSGLTDIAATLSWFDEPSASSFQVWYGPQGFFQGTQTGGGTKTIVTNDSLNLTGLSPNTCYEFLVRNICAPGDSSAWVGPVSFCTFCSNQLSGTYTIGGPSGPTNFPTLDSAVSVLNSCGASGPVVFNMNGGIHAPVIFEEAPGVSATNSVTFNASAGGDTIMASSGNAIQLNGADYITFNGFHIESGSGYTVWLHNDANTISFDNCTIASSRTTSSSSDIALAATGSPTSPSSSGNNARNLSITNSQITGGYYGVTVYGIGSTSHVKGLNVTACDFEDQYYYTLRSYYMDSVQVIDNYIHPTRNSSFSYGIYLYYNEFVEVTGNIVEEVAAYALYSYYTGRETGGPGRVSVIANNMFNGLGTYGAYMYGNNYTDFHHNTVNGGTHGMYLGGSTTIPFTNLDVRNNIFTSNGTGRALWVVTEPLSGFTLDYNLYFNYVGTEIGYQGGTAFTDLASWQSAHSSYNANSVVGDPVYISSSDLHVLGSVANDVGDNSVGIAVDVDGNVRPASGSTTVDIGADEFTPLAGDLDLISGDFIKGLCLTTNDSIVLEIHNLIGSMVDFATDPLTITYDVSGAASTTGSITINSGTLNSQDTLVVYEGGIDLSVSGNYVLNAYLDTNAVNVMALNDTLTPADIDVKPEFEADPKTVLLPSAGDSTEICIESSFFGGGSEFIITEVCHYAGFGTGGPTGTWNIDDYIEITGVPGSDLDGFTLEQWENGSLDGSFTFTSGTVLSPNGTAIIATGSNNTNSDPTNFIYDGRGAAGVWSSGNNAGRILKDPQGNIVDAVGYNSSYSFPASSGVTSAHWSGNTASTTGTAGIRLMGPDTDDATNWVVVSASNPQDPNVLNSNVPLPKPAGAPGFTWSYNGNVIDTLSCIMAGPFTSGGSHHFIASYSNACGTYTDTVTVIVPSCSAPSALSGSAVSATSVDVTWDSTGTGAANFDVEYGPVGFTIGNGTRVSASGTSSTITGLAANLCQDFYVRASCGATDTSAWIGPVNICPEITICTDDMEAYNVAPIAAQSSLFVGWYGPDPGACMVSTAQASSGSQSIYIPGDGVSDIVAYFDTIDQGTWNFKFDIFVPSGSEAYYNIQRNYTHGDPNQTNVWAFDVNFFSTGTASVDGGSFGGTGIATFSYNPGQWNTIEHIIDFDNDSVYIRVNGTATNAWVYSFGNVTAPVQANGINFYSNPNLTNPDYYVDDLCISPYVPSGCPAPTALNATNIGCDSAEVSWNSSTAAVASVVEYGAAGFTPGTGSGTVMLGSSPMLISGLTMGTNYEFYVVDSCANDTSQVAGPYSFTTATGPLSADFSFSFGTPGANNRTVFFDAGISQGGNTYTWDFGDGNTGTGMNVSNIYSSNGSYIVELVIDGPCGTDSITDTVSVEGISLVDHIIAKSLSIYPNPTSSDLRISFDTHKSEDVEISIFDLSGKMVKSVRAEDLQGRYDEVLDISNLADGTYMLKINSSDVSVVRRIVKR